MSIIATTDGSPESRQIVEVGEDLATAYGDDLVVLHVLSEDEFEDHRDEMEELDPEDDYSVAKAEQRAARVARKITNDIPGVRDSVEMLGRVGMPVEEILSVAAERDARYLVIGGRKRTPVGKAIFGSTTQSVLLHADTPVVTVMRED